MIFSITWAACGGDAATQHRVAAPVSPASHAAPAPVAPPAPGVSQPDPASPITASGADSVRAAVEPPAPAEPVALPPCPDGARSGGTQNPDHVVQLVALSPSMTVVDLGSGSGYMLCRLSRAVGPHGRVIATEVDKGLVRELNKRIAREQLSNVEVILAPGNDVGVAAGSVDRILLVNVWHHLPDRKRYAGRIARALAPGGKVVVVDFKPAARASGHGINPERVLAELAAGGIDGALVSEDLPDQYVIVGSRRVTSSMATR